MKERQGGICFISEPWEVEKNIFHQNKIGQMFEERVFFTLVQQEGVGLPYL